MKSHQTGRSSRLAVVPSEPMFAYDRAGYGRMMEGYFNPGGMFDEVFVLSPRETGRTQNGSLHIWGVSEADFVDTLHDIKPKVVRGYGGYWACDLVCSRRLPDIPVVVSVHDTNVELLHGSLRLADMVICMSQAVAEATLRIGVPEDRIRILPNRVDLNLFKPNAEPSFQEQFRARFPGGRRLLHVGRKVEQKNLDTVIQALAALPSHYVCIFVGGGDVDQYKRIATGAGVSDRCFWVDSVPNEELSSWYSAADCMCTPSRWEGFGIVFIEAAACGAPIVTSNIAPMNEYLTHGVSAHLVDHFEDPAALAVAVEKVCEDEGYKAMIGKGARTASLVFAKEKVDALEGQLYQEAIALGPISKSKQLRSLALRTQLLVNRRIATSTARRWAVSIKRILKHILARNSHT